MPGGVMNDMAVETIELAITKYESPEQAKKDYLDAVALAKRLKRDQDERAIEISVHGLHAALYMGAVLRELQGYKGTLGFDQVETQTFTGLAKHLGISYDLAYWMVNARKLYDETPETVLRYVAECEEAGRLVSIKRLHEMWKAMQADPQPATLSGTFETIVIDPPWPMAVIERDQRTDQQAMPYGTMSLDQIAKYRLPNTADDAHLFCWTTQRFLPATFSIIEGWGFKYVLTLVWHKSGGFQPVGLPQYNCEFCLYGRKGSPKFTTTKAFPTCFEGARREHSRKPVEFYELVQRVTQGPRADVFSRETKEGFVSAGNEIERFNEEAADGVS